MTKEEATKKVRDAAAVWGSGAMLVDSLVALGLLKLDEPKSADARFQEIVGRLKFGWKTEELLTAMENAGLKIVQK